MNVTNSAALQTISEMPELYCNVAGVYEHSRKQFMNLLRECLAVTSLSGRRHIFSQKRGLTIGQRLAPVAAICFMSKIE